MLPGLTALPRDSWHKIHWWKHSTNPGMLSSMIRYPHAYPRLNLYLVPEQSPALTSHCPECVDSSSLVVACEAMPDSMHRFYVHGNHKTLSSAPGIAYEQAFRAITATELEKVALFTLPEALVPTANACFAQAGYRASYYRFGRPCWQLAIIGPPQVELVESWRHLVASTPSPHVLGPLLPEDLEWVNDNWTYGGPGTLQFLADRITGATSMCIRSAHTTSGEGKGEEPDLGPNRLSKPLSWALEMSPGGLIGIVHTLEGERRRGHSRRVIAALLLQLLSEQEKAVAEGRMTTDAQYLGGYVVEDNVASLRLMESLGLKRVGQYSWMAYEKTMQAE